MIDLAARKQKRTKSKTTTDNITTLKIRGDTLYPETATFEYVKSVIGSGYETLVADLAIRDGVAYRAARKNMQIHSAIILKLGGIFSGFFTFQVNHEVGEFCLLQSAMEPGNEDKYVYSQMVEEIIKQNTFGYPMIMTVSTKHPLECPQVFEAIGFKTYLDLSGYAYMVHGTFEQIRRKAIPDGLLGALSDLKGLCINTSASALDTDEQTEYRVAQFERLKPYCKSVLRIVSCEFNSDNEEGRRRGIVQERLFKLGKCIDTVFRPSADNPFVVNGVIKVEKARFLRKDCLASIYNKRTYFGKCGTCPDMCGVTVDA